MQLVSILGCNKQFNFKLDYLLLIKYAICLS